VRFLRALARETTASGRDGPEPPDGDVSPACLAEPERPRANALERGVDLVEFRLLAVVKPREEGPDLRSGGVLDWSPYLALAQRAEFILRDAGGAQ
jgi:hypothetical protein